MKNVLFKKILAILLVCCTITFCACSNKYIDLIKKTVSPDKGVVYISDETYVSEPSAEDISLYEGIKYVNKELIIHMAEGTERDDVVSLVENYGGKIVGEIAITGTYQIRFDKEYTFQELNEVITDIESNDIVLWGSLDTIFECDSDYYPKSDSEWSDEWDDMCADGLNWGVEAIYAPEAWEFMDEMTSVNVGVYDCCFYQHEDINYSELYCNNTAKCPVEVAHGTHVTGTLGASFDNGIGISGIVPYSNLYCFSSYGLEQNQTYLMKYEIALTQLIVEDNCKVVNISLNTGRERSFAASMGVKTAIDSIEVEATEISRYLEQIIKNGKNDFVICVAAGNSNDTDYVADASAEYGYREATNNDNEKDYIRGNVQAKYNNFLNAIENEIVKEHIVVVGACGTTGENKYQYSTFSNVGERVDVVAPGEKIYSTVDNNKYANDIWSGTSMATPHVSGVAAMLFSVDDSLTGKEVKELIKTTAGTKVDDCDYKMVNAYQAVASAVKGTLVVALDDEEKKIRRNKYKEILAFVDKNGILPMKDERFISADPEIWSDMIGSDEFFYEYYDYYLRYESDYFTAMDIDNDGKEELLIAGSYTGPAYGASSISIYEYDCENDVIELEGSIPTNCGYFEEQHFSTHNSMIDACFYDNGVVICELPWVNEGMGFYVSHFKYDKDSDTYIEQNINRDYVIDVWDKKVEQTIGNIEFPDELDLDGNGKIYCKTTYENAFTTHCVPNEVYFDSSEWKDIMEIEELNIPDGEEHKIYVDWCDLHTYVQTGELVQNEDSMSELYERITSCYFFRRYNNKEDEQGVFYSVMDINNDGTDELIVGAGIIDENGDTSLCNMMRIYTFKDGNAYLLSYDDSYMRDGYHSIYENAILHLEENDSGYRVGTFYCLPKNSTKLEAIETVYMDTSDGQTTKYYHNKGGVKSNIDELEVISEEEYNAIFATYKIKSIEVNYVTIDDF